MNSNDLGYVNIANSKGISFLGKKKKKLFGLGRRENLNLYPKKVGESQITNFLFLRFHL